MEHATYLRNQNLVASADTHGDAVAILGQETRANSEDLGLVLLLDAALGQEDARGGLGLGLDALDEDAVQEGSKALDVAKDRLLRPKSVCCAPVETGCMAVEIGDGRKRMSELSRELIPKGGSLEIELQCVVYS